MGLETAVWSVLEWIIGGLLVLWAIGLIMFAWLQRWAIPAKAWAPLDGATIAGAGAGYVSISWTHAEIRYHPSGKGYGSPASFSCNATRAGHLTWLSMGEQKSDKFTPHIHSEIIKALQSVGAENIQWDRRDEHGKIRKRVRE